MGLKYRQTDDADLNRFQRDVAAELEERASRALTRRVDVFIAAGGTATVRHGVRPRPRGWRIVSQDADANVWQTKLDGSVLELSADADVNVAVEVF